MFPRLVHSAAKAEKSNLMNLVLLGTAVLSIVGAISVSLLGPLLIRFVSGEKFVAVASALDSLVCLRDGAARCLQRAAE